MCCWSPREAGRAGWQGEELLSAPEGTTTMPSGGYPGTGRFHTPLRSRRSPSSYVWRPPCHCYMAGTRSSARHIKMECHLATQKLQLLSSFSCDGRWTKGCNATFDDCIPGRAFDNFKFVNFTDIMSTSKDMSKKEVAFALAAWLLIAPLLSNPLSVISNS